MTEHDDDARLARSRPGFHKRPKKLAAPAIKAGSAPLRVKTDKLAPTTAKALRAWNRIGSR
jgi:hypothetical protein